MNLITLYRQIGSQLKIKPDAAEALVCVEVQRKGSIGGTPVVLARSAGLGIDWNNGKFVITTETPIKDAYEERELSMGKERNILKRARTLTKRKMKNKFLYMRVFGGDEGDAEKRCREMGVDPDAYVTNEV